MDFVGKLLLTLVLIEQLLKQISFLSIKSKGKTLCHCKQSGRVINQICELDFEEYAIPGVYKLLPNNVGYIVPKK